MFAPMTLSPVSMVTGKSKLIKGISKNLVMLSLSKHISWYRLSKSASTGSA